MKVSESFTTLYYCSKKFSFIKVNKRLKVVKSSMHNIYLLDWENYNEDKSKIVYVPSVLSKSILIMARKIPNCVNCLDFNDVRPAK